ncbi:MAG: FAD-dependent oxidoreductase [Acidobacteria bacterium]|jgi:L-aspartate oxidase|nr:FAD-dependent oxidoreductase [Acidobacteriota bacterium]
MKDYLETDVLVIGGGIAGATAALRLAEGGRDVLLVSKGKDHTRTNTYYAQGGIAALPAGEKAELFAGDIIKAGDEFNYRPAVDQAVRESWPLVQEILIDKLQVPFSKKGGEYDLAKEGGHSTRRVLNVRDMTGRVIQDRFNEILEKLPRLKMLFQHTAIDLLSYPHHSLNPARTYQEPRIIGAYVLDQKSKKVTRVFARKVVLASGGLSSLYLHSTNPEEAIGNGIAMAHRAGARLANLEYVQFHPTSLYHREADSFLISEAVRGEGARLMNLKGEYFMEKYSPLKDLAPRDEVSRAIYEEMIKHGSDYALLDLASFARINIRERFPTIFQNCLKYGINIEEKPIPVVPAAHYSCGGVLCDLNGRSSIRNLYAIGEVSATGVHGANRLASVSLLEALVWGDKAAADILSVIDDDKDPYVIAEVPEWKYPHPQEKLDPALVWQDLVTIKTIMWNYNGIIRTVKRMERAKADLEYLKHRIEKFYKASEIGNRIVSLRDSVQAALLIVEAALRNRVSRGAHFIKADDN